jgi:hypothetical protein
MFWADTLSDATEVVDVQPLRWLALKMTVAPPVRIYFFALILERTIPTPVKGAGPLPAAVGLVDFDVVHKT